MTAATAKPARGPSGGQSQLWRAAQLSEGLKAIVALSREISLIAVNAGLASRRAQPPAPGFVVACRELQGFCTRLESAVMVLDRIVADFIRRSATLGVARRLHGLLRVAAGASQAAERFVLAAERTKQGSVELQSKELAVLIARLLERLSHALRMCRNGQAIARTTGIEAVYVNGHARRLKDLATEMENDMERLMNILKGEIAGLASRKHRA